MNERILNILKDDSQSYWLKESLIKVLNRNPIDAALDADILAIVLNGRARLV